MSPEIAQAIIAGIVVIWAVIQTIVTWRISRNTEETSRQIQRLNTQMDQSLQRLHRARELINKAHEADLLMFYFSQQKDQEKSALKYIEWSTYFSELRGLARAIDDKSLWELVNAPTASDKYDGLLNKEMTLRLYSQKLHTRVSQLLQETTTTTSIIQETTEK